MAELVSSLINNGEIRNAPNAMIKKREVYENHKTCAVSSIEGSDCICSLTIGTRKGANVRVAKKNNRVAIRANIRTSDSVVLTLRCFSNISEVYHF
jgi:hypothetical protein